MKRWLCLTVGLLIAFSTKAQQDTDNVAKHNETLTEMMTYDRSSLCVVMIYHPEDEFGKDIMSAFASMPFPDKYDNHDIGVNVIENNQIPPAHSKLDYGLIKAEYGNNLRAGDLEDNSTTLEKMLNDAHVANYLIAKWFGLYDGEVCNVDLIKERGQYNATELDVAIANQSARGLAMLSDAGEMLIGNTYMLINDMTYVTAEEKAAAAKKGLSIIGGIIDGLFGGNLGKNMALVGSSIADSFTGFAVKNHSYLFRLQWNDELAAIFYDEYYMMEPDPVKLNKFLTDSRFTVKYVAHEYETSEKTVSKGKYSRSDLVKMVCKRSLDKNIAALQLQYEDFKVKTPIYEVVMDERGRVDGYAVKIGMKEGITEKSTFQVVRKVVDPETNKTTYRYVASLKAMKGKIWDNRFMAAEEQEDGSDLQYSTLRKTSGGEILPGMLVIEGKYSKIRD